MAITFFPLTMKENSFITLNQVRYISIQQHEVPPAVTIDGIIIPVLLTFW